MDNYNYNDNCDYDHCHRSDDGHFVKTDTIALKADDNKEM